MSGGRAVPQREQSMPRPCAHRPASAKHMLDAGDLEGEGNRKREREEATQFVIIVLKEANRAL